MQWVDKKIQVSTDYLMRIMDNITSNVLKYADPAYPIVISSAQEEHMAGFSFENHIRKTEETVESTGIGIQSIRNMTLKMKAKCQVEQEGDQFRLTKEKLLEKLTPRTKILILPFPNNPTGSIMEREDLEEIACIAKEKDLFLLSDEIYSELTYGRRHCTIAALPGMKERTVLINGFSKSYAMTGWRLGYACAPERILKQMLKIHQYAIMCAPTVSQYAAVEALRNGDKDVEEMREAYDQRRRFLVKSLREMGFDCYEPQGAFYVFPSVKRFGMTSEEFALRLLEEEKVAVVPGTAFGENGEGYLRLSYAYSLKDLERALARMERFVGRLLEQKPLPGQELLSEQGTLLSQKSKTSAEDRR